jgi:hypothetical protein
MVGLENTMIDWIKEQIDNILELAKYRVTWKTDNMFEVNYWSQLDGRTLHCIATLPVEVTIGNFTDDDCGEMFFYQINRELENDSKNKIEKGVPRSGNTDKHRSIECP